MIKRRNYTKEITVAVCLCLFATFIMLFAPTLTNYISAYFTDNDIETNSVSVGYNDIQVVEDFEPPKELAAGISFTKDVKVQNTGTVDCFVRVKALFTNSDMEQYCEVNYDTINWAYNDSDGYYYLINSVSVNEFSPSLFTTVKIKDDVESTEIKDFDILIYAESYQAYGYDTYQSAWSDFYKNKN